MKIIAKTTSDNKVGYLFADNTTLTIENWVEYPIGADIILRNGVYNITTASDIPQKSLDIIKDREDFLAATKGIVPYNTAVGFFKPAYQGRLMHEWERNPYFVCDLDSDNPMGFAILDAMLDIPTFELRLQELYAAFRAVLHMSSMQGHTCLNKQAFLRTVNKILRHNNHEASEDLLEAALDSFQDSIVLGTFVTSKQAYRDETMIYEWIRAAKKAHAQTFEYTPVLALSKEQNEALRMLSSCCNIACVTGGPGTGKTTIIKSFITQYHVAHPDRHIYLVAPTNKACARITETFANAPCEVTTIHYLAGWGHKITRNDIDRMHKADLILIDESSMLGVSILASLLKFVDPSKTKILLFGDADQLPSVEPGEIFTDIMACKVPTAKLTHNFRSGDDIVGNALKINNGAFPNGRLNHFHMYKWDRADIAQFSNIVLTPFRKEQTSNGTVLPGNCGTINKTKHNDLSVGFKAGEPVMATATNRKAGYCNAQTGIIKEVRPREALVLFDNQSTPVSVRYSDLTLAYAITIHKSEGSEYDNVVILIPPGSERFVTRQMLYTAVTRGKKDVTVYTSPETLQAVLNNTTKERRATNLKILTEVLHQGVG